MNKSKKILLIIVVLVAVAAAAWYINKYVYRPRAGGGPNAVSVSISPSSADLKTGDTHTTTITVDSNTDGQNISGVDVTINSTGGIQLLAATPPKAPDGTEFQEVVKTVTSDRIRLSYILIKPDSQLPNLANFTVSFKKDADGSGTIQVVPSQVVGTVTGRTFEIGDQPTGNYTFSTSGTPGGGGGDVINDPPPVGTGPVKLNLKVRFQGVVRKPNTSTTLPVKVKLGGAQERDYVTANLTVDDSGVWSGTANFDVPAGGGYVVYIKGPKHLQRKLCTVRPTETAPGTARCVGGVAQITLQNGDNSIDATNTVMLVGDIPDQDGIVTSYDTSYIRNNLGSKDSKVLETGDLNYDGIVDTQDFSLILASLSVKYDEE